MVVLASGEEWLRGEFRQKSRHFGGIPMASDGQIGNPAIYPARMAGSLYPGRKPDMVTGWGLMQSEMSFNESIVEEAALTWFGELGYERWVGGAHRLAHGQPGVG